MRKKRKTVWAFLDGKKLVDVVQAALDNNMMVDDLKAKLIAENPGHEVTFILSNETIVAQHPWTTDVELELERIRKEKEEAMEQAQDYTGAFGNVQKEDPDGDEGGDE